MSLLPKCTCETWGSYSKTCVRHTWAYKYEQERLQAAQERKRALWQLARRYKPAHGGYPDIYKRD